MAKIDNHENVETRFLRQRVAPFP
jgi:Cytochrome P450